VFEKTVQVQGEAWEPQTLLLRGLRDLALSVEASASVKAGWGELTIERDSSWIAPQKSPHVLRSYLAMRDVRNRPQLLSGWYSIEDGSWRWMAKSAEVILATPKRVSSLDIQLYFPANHMQRAGGAVTMTVLINDKVFAQNTYQQPGGYKFTKAVASDVLTYPNVRIAIQMDRAAPPNGTDLRQLGAVIQGMGFLPIDSR
jgi:hypothetical protein